MKFIKLLMVMSLCAGLAACQTAPKTTTQLPGYISKDAAKKVHIGKPYTIKGKTYYPSYQPSYDETGIASWYGPGFHGKKTANGEIYDQYAMTAAHPTLPIPSLVRVTNLDNGQTAIVRVNDRGPFAEGRVIDLSRKAAETIGIRGISKVRVTYMKEQTEAHWEERNFGSKTIPALATKRRNIPHYEYVERDETVEAEPAPIMSVGSTQIATLDLSSRSNAVVISDGSQHYPDDNMPAEREPASVHSNTLSPPRDLAQRDDSLHLDRRDVPPTKDPPPMASESGYFIQAGAFASEGNAKLLVERLMHIGNAFSEKLDRPGGSLYRVRVGPYPSRAGASNELHEFFKLGIKDAAIVAVK